MPRTRCLHSSLRWSMYNTPFKWSNLIRSARVQNRVARSPEPRMHAPRRTAGAANRSRRAADGWRAVLVQEHASEPPIQLERYWLAIGGQRCHLLSDALEYPQHHYVLLQGPRSECTGGRHRTRSGTGMDWRRYFGVVQAAERAASAVPTSVR